MSNLLSGDLPNTTDSFNAIVGETSVLPIISLLINPGLTCNFRANSFDPIWVGVLVVLISEIGFMTPPVGLNAFVVHGVTHVSLSDIFLGALPFVVMMFLGVAILLIFPQVVLVLPNLTQGL